MFTSKLDFDFETNQKIISKISKIDLFKGKWETIAGKESRYLKELKRIATIESIGSSTRIEGVTLNDKEIENLLHNIKVTKFVTRDEQEVVGYYETLNIIFDDFKSIGFSENYISQLHGILLKESDKDQRHRGKYKSLSNKVVATYPDGKQKIIFNTTEPHLVKKEMSDLVEWVNSQFSEGILHPLIIISAFVYEFLSIHPFQDGNGRLSRLLTTLLLLKYDYDFIQYISFEHIIEERKKDYYKALKEGQKNRNTKKEKIDKWIFFFLSSLETLIQKLEIKYNTFQNQKGYINERQKSIIEIFEKDQPLKVRDIHKKIGGSINTIKKDLAYLVAEKYLEKFGVGRGTIYLAKNNNT